MRPVPSTMEFPPNSAQALALRALHGGELRRTAAGWVVTGEDADQIVTVDVVRWLFGERYAELDPDAPTGVEAYRMTAHGRAAAEELARARAEAGSDTALGIRLSGRPVLLVAPAHHSEEMDWILVLPLSEVHVERHRSRLRAVEALEAAAEQGLEFVQYVDEIYALPMSPRAAELDLVPPPEDGFQLVPEGLPDPDGLGAARCADRGVNYGVGWMQAFGGFDRESPLIIGARIDRGVLERVLDDAGASNVRA